MKKRKQLLYLFTFLKSTYTFGLFALKKKQLQKKS